MADHVLVTIMPADGAGERTTLGYSPGGMGDFLASQLRGLQVYPNDRSFIAAPSRVVAWLQYMDILAHVLQEGERAYRLLRWPDISEFLLIEDDVLLDPAGEDLVVFGFQREKRLFPVKRVIFPYDPHRSA